MHFSNMSHDGRKHIEISVGKFFVAYNEFFYEFSCKEPPQTAGVHILRIGHFEIGYW